MIATLCVNQGKIELPIEFIQQYNIKENSFIDFVFGEQENTALLRIKDDEKPVFKSGFGMVKTDIPAVPVDFDVSVFARDI